MYTDEEGTIYPVPTPVSTPITPTEIYSPGTLTPTEIYSPTASLTPTEIYSPGTTPTEVYSIESMSLTPTRSEIVLPSTPTAPSSLYTWTVTPDCMGADENLGYPQPCEALVDQQPSEAPANIPDL